MFVHNSCSHLIVDFAGQQEQGEPRRDEWRGERTDGHQRRRQLEKLISYFLLVYFLWDLEVFSAPVTSVVDEHLFLSVMPLHQLVWKSLATKHQHQVCVIKVSCRDA